MVLRPNNRTKAKGGYPNERQKEFGAHKKENLYREYYRLKDEVPDAEIIKRNVEQVIRGNEPDRKTNRTNEAEL